ncbi:MAG TPA: Gfo/Idh/MocA family oxidoreductase [Kofleriaceae bacterium]|nr:Gfo/Idh/MocA family oxidoreductase [Kofleriaceae bacterium]
MTREVADEPPCLMLVGLGRHTQEDYFPLLERSPRRPRLGCVVELASRRADVERFLDRRGWKPASTIYIDDHDSGSLSAALASSLDAKIAAHGIRGVMVATPPERHLDYALWAASRGLHMLVDKPLTSRPGVLWNERQGAGMLDDSEQLASALARAPAPRPICIVAVHRRFHPAWQLMQARVRECVERVNCPITSIHAEYSDGEWRLPHDVLGQHYHPYQLGYGILSHSGYHLIDAAMTLVEASQCAGKEVDTLEASTVVVPPAAQLSQTSFADYERLFPADQFRARNPYSEGEYRRATAQFGEMDVFAIAQFTRRGDAVTTATFQLQHNSLSHRGWVDVGDRNLYMGNGRLRHESYVIRQGPFQLIRLHSLQARKESFGTAVDTQVGGNNHIEVLVFRNREIFGHADSFRHYKADELDLGLETGLPTHLQACKRTMLDEFLRVVSGDSSQLVGSLESHMSSIKVMSTLYRAAARRLAGNSEVLRVPFSFEREEHADAVDARHLSTGSDAC